MENLFFRLYIVFSIFEAYIYFIYIYVCFNLTIIFKDNYKYYKIIPKLSVIMFFRREKNRLCKLRRAFLLIVTIYKIER